MNGPGFYRLHEGVMFYAPNFVHTSEGLWTVAEHSQDPPPGWHFFVKEEYARDVLGDPDPEYDERLA